jgi:predicted CopG family antitoxin
MVKCNKKNSKKPRTTLSITIDQDILSKLRAYVKKEGESSISSVVEGFIDCGIRKDCEGCPYSEDLPEGQEEEVMHKIGVNKFAK